jgi:hypothetical protein
MTHAFSIYGEDKYWDVNFKTTFPYLWFMGYRVAPSLTRLPLLILDMPGESSNLFEVGNRGGTWKTGTVHVFAKSRGEREDLADVIYQNLFNIRINDYTTTPPTFKYNATVESRNTSRQGVGEELGKEGTLKNWKTVQFSFQLLE